MRASCGIGKRAGFTLKDRNQYPPGDGTGSASLAAALLAPGPRGIPYLEQAKLILTPAGDIVNPVFGGKEILFYCRNFPGLPGDDAINKGSFDIWGWGCRGDRAKGAPTRRDLNLVSNW